MSSHLPDQAQRHDEGKDSVPHLLYLALSALSTLSNLASYYAIMDLPYITVVVGKSVKPLPVLVFGNLLGGKRYSLVKCLSVVTEVMGMMIFLLPCPEVDKDHRGEGQAWYLGSGNRGTCRNS